MNHSLSSVHPPSWQALYPQGLGPDLSPEHGTALQLFETAVAARPAHPAMWYFNRSLSYSEVAAAADALASFWSHAGVRRGDRVFAILQNCPEFLISMIATWKLGAIPVPANPMYRRGELARLFADAEPVAIVCETDHQPEVQAAFAALGTQLPTVLTTYPESFRGNAAAVDVGTFAKAIEDWRDHSPGAAPPAPDDLGLLLYTSGTTGAPKGAMIHHSSLASNGQLVRDWCSLGRDTRVLGIAPFFHITGLVCHLLAAMSARATVVAHYRFDPEVVLDVVRQTRPTFTIGAITAFNALMNAPGAMPDDFASFERVYSGGAPIPPALVEKLRTALGIVIHTSYGMTETTAPTHLAPFGREIPIDPASGALSIGVPVPSTEAMVVDDGGRELSPGEVGELLVRGPQVMAGYWRKAEESATALRGGWMHTGDVGFRDSAGWFYLVDRKKDVIIASGFKVWPREVEDALYAHPAVREAAVVGTPDSYRGETVKAVVSFKPGAQATEAELITHCRSLLAAYKVPRGVQVLPGLPMTATGKIQRMAVREIAAKGIPSTHLTDRGLRSSTPKSG